MDLLKSIDQFRNMQLVMYSLMWAKAIFDEMLPNEYILNFTQSLNIAFSVVY
jgi:hypothetical protein